MYSENIIWYHKFSFPRGRPINERWEADFSTKTPYLILRSEGKRDIPVPIHSKLTKYTPTDFIVTWDTNKIEEFDCLEDALHFVESLMLELEPKATKIRVG